MTCPKTLEVPPLHGTLEAFADADHNGKYSADTLGKRGLRI